MKSLIVYGSQYGTTKQYAEKFAELTGLPAVSYENVKGLKNTVKALGENTKLIIATVGLADVQDKENTDNIRNSIKQQVPAPILERTKIFHLRGGIDYKKLSFKHRTMMTLLYNRAKKLPEEKKNAEVRAMIETFNSVVDFVDYDSLNQILKEI